MLINLITESLSNPSCHFIRFIIIITKFRYFIYQFLANDFFSPLEHPIYGRIEIVANPAKLSKTPATINKPAPEVGQDTDEILLEIGYTQENIAELRGKNVIN